MAAAPAVLFLDDGELVGVRTALGQLGVDFEHVVGFKGDRANVFRPQQLLVTSARLALKVESLQVADDSTEPVWVCAHNQDFLVTRGQTVQRGQTIARIGSSGNVATPQPHFEIRKGAHSVNPARYLGPQQATAG